MKLCLMSDLHLPYCRGTAVDRALDWALADAAQRDAALLLVAGDITADGDPGAAHRFRARMEACGIPWMAIPGNADLRTQESADEMAAFPALRTWEREGIRVFGVSDCTASLPGLLPEAGPEDVVFLHHPPEALEPVSRARFGAWRAAHPETAVFFGHLHRYQARGRTVSLPALDPDKNIGAPPSVIYYDTRTHALERSCAPAPFPWDMGEYIGISCYRPLEDLPYAAAHRLPALELRPNALGMDRSKLRSLVEDWRQVGGHFLSLHLPDIVFARGAVQNGEDLAPYPALVRELGAERVTLHVPDGRARELACPGMLERVADFAVSLIDQLPEDCRVGVENMHMTAADTPEDRRFGYLPQECHAFAARLRAGTAHPVGFNLDVGHARNNAPFSQKYTLSAWYRELGAECVGYHLHQVRSTETGFQNHEPITGLYGPLISFASFLEGWRSGELAHAPVILEIRQPAEGYRQTVELLEQLRGSSAEVDHG